MDALQAVTAVTTSEGEKMWFDAKVEIRSIPAKTKDDRIRYFVAIHRGDGHVEVETDYDTALLIALTIARDVAVDPLPLASTKG